MPLLVVALFLGLAPHPGPMAAGATGTPQEPLVLRAHARTLDVQDGERLWKGLWGADPSLALDTYYAQRFSGRKTVTFVSDLDSLAFEVAPGQHYDFTILLDGKESCATRISTSREAYRSRRDAPIGAPDVIPFELVNGRIHVQATVNGSEPLDLLFDTGADNLVLHPSAVDKGARLAFDGNIQNSGLGGVQTRRTSSDNRLEIEGLAWSHELVLYIENQSSDCDGILGYIAFEDKVLEIDYDRGLLLVHDSLPVTSADFTRFPTRFEGTLLALETGFGTGRERGSDWFVIDTGASAALHLNQAFARRHGLYEALEHIGTSESRGVGPGVLHNQVALLPELSFGPYILHDVPTHLETPDQGKDFASGCFLGMDVLQRFDTLLDLPHDAIYLRPSKLLEIPFRRDFGGFPRRAALAAAVVLALAALVFGRLRAIRRKAV